MNIENTTEQWKTLDDLCDNIKKEFLKKDLSSSSIEQELIKICKKYNIEIDDYLYVEGYEDFNEFLEDIKNINKETADYDPDDLSQYILDYIKNTFNCNIENSFVRNTFENIISYGVNQKNYGVDQLAYFLSDMFDEIEFAEMKNVLNKYSYEKNKEEQDLGM